MLDIGNIKLIIKGDWGENGRKFIYFEFLVLRGMGIVERPLFERNIFADKKK